MYCRSRVIFSWEFCTLETPFNWAPLSPTKCCLNIQGLCYKKSWFLLLQFFFGKSWQWNSISRPELFYKYYLTRRKLWRNGKHLWIMSFQLHTTMLEIVPTGMDNLFFQLIRSTGKAWIFKKVILVRSCWPMKILLTFFIILTSGLISK